VEYAHPNYIRTTGPVAQALASSLEGGTPGSGSVPAVSGQPFTPNDPDFSLLQWNFPLVGIPGAWGINQGGSSSITVAVIDTGVTSAPLTLTTPLWNGSAFVSTAIPFAGSPDLSASRIVNPHDFVFNTTTNVVLDMDGHATHVSSTIGEDTNNLLALAGIAFNVQIMPIKVCSGYWESMIQRGIAGTPGFTNIKTAGCPDSAIIAGIELAAQSGVKVINLSLGGSQPEPGLQTAIQDAVNAGAFVAISMGNAFATGNPIEYPAFYAASIDGAMSVAAVTSTMTHASYSSSGSYCEIAAPGGDGPSSALTSFVWQGTLNFNDQSQLLVAPRFDRYAEVGYEGTSMAAPHVAGLAALIMSQYPGIKPAQVEALIKRTAMDLGDKTLFGSGLIQARAALFGFGIAK
jgi:serine protease